MNDERGMDWPPLHDGHNEPGPTDEAGEYRASQQLTPDEPNVGLGGKLGGARVPGQAQPGQAPVDIASESQVPPRIEEDVLSPAERAMGDTRHIARGKSSMSSSYGSAYGFRRTLSTPGCSARRKASRPSSSA